MFFTAGCVKQKLPDAGDQENLFVRITKRVSGVVCGDREHRRVSIVFKCGVVPPDKFMVERRAFLPLEVAIHRRLTAVCAVRTYQL